MQPCQSHVWRTKELAQHNTLHADHAAGHAFWIVQHKRPPPVLGMSHMQTGRCCKTAGCMNGRYAARQRGRRTARRSLTELYRRLLGTQMVTAQKPCCAAAPLDAPAPSLSEYTGLMVGPW